MHGELLLFSAFSIFHNADDITPMFAAGQCIV